MFDLPVFVLPLVLRATIFYIWVCLKVNSPTAEDVHHVSNENGRVGVLNKSILAENLENSDYFGIDTPYNFHHSSDSQWGRYNFPLIHWLQKNTCHPSIDRQRFPSSWPWTLRIRRRPYWKPFPALRTTKLVVESEAPKIWAPMGLNKDHHQKNVLKCHEQSLKRPTDNDSCVSGRNISTVGRVDKPTIVRGPQQRPVFLAFGYQRWPGDSPAANRTCWLSMIIHYAWTHVLGLNCPISTNTHILLGCVDWIWFCPILMTVDFIPAPSFNI